MSKNIKTATEMELRKMDVPWFVNEKDLIKYIKTLADREHNYSTCSYAMSMSAVAAFQFIAGKLGSTRFQGSCADLDFLRRIRDIEHGFRILDYTNLLYPQYLNGDYFPTAKELIEKNKEILVKQAKKLLKKNKDAHEDVIAHWKYLANLK